MWETKSPERSWLRTYVDRHNQQAHRAHTDTQSHGHRVRTVLTPRHPATPLRRCPSLPVSVPAASHPGSRPLPPAPARPSVSLFPPPTLPAPCRAPSAPLPLPLPVSGVRPPAQLLTVHPASPPLPEASASLGRICVHL